MSLPPPSNPSPDRPAAKPPASDVPAQRALSRPPGVPFAGSVRPAKPLPVNPRRVRGGVKISAAEQQTLWSDSWAAQRWVRLIEQGAPGKRAVDGLEYAVLGQTKSMHIEPGTVVAAVQGRADRAYQVKLSMPVIGAEDWDRVVRVMTEQALYGAKLLAGDLPANIDDVFIPMGLALFPSKAEDLTCSCTCTDFAADERARSARKAAGEEPGPVLWCKHAACAAYLVAQRLSSDPFQMFRLRGLDGHELLERLRHSRAVASSSKTNPSVYAGRVPGVSDAPPAAYGADADFWDLPPEFDQLEAPIQPPPVSHPLLRRLGPSPLSAPATGRAAPPAAFPLVGLLASCYETISESIIREELRPVDPSVPPLSDSDLGQAAAPDDDAAG